MQRDLFVEQESFPLAQAFAISRGKKTHADILTCTILQDGHRGRGECVPYARYGESMESVKAQIDDARAAIGQGMSRHELVEYMPAGAARNALDCALWDLEAKMAGQPVHQAINKKAPGPLITAMTIGLGEPEEMAAQAGKYAARPLLKVKVGTSDDVARIRAVRQAAPQSKIILDANEGWSEDDIATHLAVSAEMDVALIEQPLAQGQDAILHDIDRKVPICADESVHTAEDLNELVGLYDAVNIKLDKTGGLTAAIELHDRARELGFLIMVGCMVGSSLAMAPAVLLAQDAEFVDLDGPLLLANDRTPGLVYSADMVEPPLSDLWG